MDWGALATVAPTALSSTLYATLQASFLWRIGRRRLEAPRGAPRPLAATPVVSVLKPVAGVDDELAGNLESFAHLDYPCYELVFGVASREDPAVPVIQAFIAAHPEVRARLCLTDPSEALNPKVAQLLELARRAEGSVLVISDANVRVRPDYLHALLSSLMRPGVGLVSSLVVGTGERTLGAVVENAQLGAFIAPGVVAAAELAGRSISVGKSMAMRRIDLERVGGFESVASVLAEDDVLGQRFSARGFVVDLCLDPVENRNTSGSLMRTLDRHTRWAKMRRALVPRCFAAEPFSSPLLIAWLTLLLSPTRFALEIWLFAWALQSLGSFLALRALRPARFNLTLVAAEPLRTLCWFFCWLNACSSRRVAWRGNAFYLGAGSTLVAAEEPVSVRSPAR
ncbi:glycosyltransferase [Sorangium sp. So ce1014]|uniref:glycosyltransferase n=1 Tax=Sorangium sp. So ce1014 TaxID=3133326 RepID=UPI003F624778